MSLNIGFIDFDECGSCSVPLLWKSQRVDIEAHYIIYRIVKADTKFPSRFYACSCNTAILDDLIRLCDDRFRDREG